MIWNIVWKFLDGNDAYLNLANDDINTTTANGKLFTSYIDSIEFIKNDKDIKIKHAHLDYNLNIMVSINI